jgi:large subunit ribosomal protein L5e
MESLEEEDDERFKKQFASYLADDIGSEDLEEIYVEAHKQIREKPVADKSNIDYGKWKSESKKHKHHKLTYDERKQRVQEKIAKYKSGDL